MIEGLKIRVTSKELNAHMTARADYHATRADTKEHELPGIKDAMAKLKSGLNPEAVAVMNKTGMSSGYNLDPEGTVEALERDIRDHRNKALAFRYLGDHLFDEDYNLSEADLKRLEILK